ncbi:complement C4-B-like [Numenius arquata]|uniref:complement C4-B-like n=1 Tax=Numenius arquata TaxID=31919 RepID=UPI003D30A9D4
MGPRWALDLLVLLLLPPLLGGSTQDPELVLVAPRLVALGTPVGLLVAAVGPVTGTVTAWPGESDRGRGPCAPVVRFNLGTHNDFSQILNIEVTPEQARRCGALEAAMGPTLLLEAQSPHLPPRGVRVGLGGPRGVLLLQTDKPLYAPRQTVRFRIFSLDPDLHPNAEPILVTITNPLGAQVREGQRVPMGPVLSDQMVLPDIAPPGQWRVQAQLVASPETRGSATFSVRPYALPRFSVQAVPNHRFLLLGPGPAPTLRMRLRVRYLDGAAVGGWAQLRVGLQGGPFLRGLEQHCKVRSGEAEFNVTLEAIVSALGVAPQELRGERLQLAVTVINDEGGEAVRQEVGVKLVDTPWALDLGLTPHFFVPGAPFLLRGRVLDASGTAAPGVQVQVGVRVTGATTPPPIQLRADPRGDIVVPINVPIGASKLSLSVEAGSPGSHPVREQVTVTPVAPVLGRFLLLEGPGGPLRPGDLLRLQLRDVGPSPAPHIYHLLAVARGRLVAAQAVHRGTVTEVTLPVTPAMAPRLRLVAFFQAEGQLVAASWGVPVVSSCHSQVRVEVGRRGSPLRPQTPLKVTGTVTLPGTPAATLALSATDAALLELEPRHRLRPAQVDTVLGRSDLGCGPGGGPDAEGMFRAAGLVLGGPDPPPGPPPGCLSTPHRPRRSSKLLELLETGAPQGNNTVVRRCCRDGGVTLPLQVTCSQRAQRVPEAGGCRVAFLRCCRHARAQRRRGAAAGVARALFPELEQEWEEEDVPTRSFFPESWMWRSVTANATASFTVLLPDSITTWEIQAIAVIPGHGLCVAVAQRVTVTQELYVGLQLPPSTRPHEQLQLLPHIHSRLPHGVNVTVTLAVAEGVCAGLDGTPQRLEVPPGGAVALPLTLVALRPGDVPVTITARGPWGLGDSITRVLHVEPEGELHLEENSYVLDTDGKEGRTLEIPGDIPAGIIPDGEFSVSIRVTGRVGGWAVRGALGTGAMLLRSPRGCGEQALMALAPRAAALHYLDHSGGWRALPPDSRPRGLRGLQRGFERVQNFRKSDGSYSAWQHRGGSTWLTALVLRVLALAHPYLPLAAGGPGTSLRWLLGQQRPDGAFHESEPVLHREMQGSVADPGPEATVSLTAFVVVALQGARVLLPPDSPDHSLLDEALSRAATFLRGHMETLGTFGTAITTYALALGDTGPPGPSPTLERLRRLARPAQDGRAQFWPAGGPAATVEATGYGLLALLQLRDGAGAARAARWLREQSNYGGGFRSTQDTLVALEALAQMWLQWGDAAGSGLNLGLSWPGGARGTPGETQVTLGPGLQSLEKELQVPLGSPITVRVEGHGEGTLMVLRQFRLMSPLNGSCQGLGLEVAVTGPIIYEEEDYEDYEEEAELEEEAEPVNGTRPEGAEPAEEVGPEKGAEPAEATAHLLPRHREGHNPASDVAFLVCIWREAGVELSGMAVAEISLLSGFRPHQGDLDKLRDVIDRWISHYELSGTRLVLYLDQVPTQRQCLSFGATQEVAVGQLQPAMATIYDYYEPARRCTVFYSTPRRSSAIPALCSGQACLCAQGACPKLRREGSLSADDRLDFACYSPRVTYALLVRTLDQTEAGPFLAFELEILEVLLGEVAAGGRGRVLWRGSCPLRLRPQRRYLLMGGEGTAAGTSQSPQFLLGPHSWLEEAPPRPRCGHAPSCPALMEFMETLRSRGCPF